MARPKTDPAKRERILEAAVKVFASKGFGSARVADVAKEAGVADGTIYLYFPSKEALLVTIFEERMASITDTAREGIERLPNPTERLEFFIRQHLGYVDDYPDLAQVMLVELRFSDRFLKEYQPQPLWDYMELLGRIVSDGQAAGSFRRDIPAGVIMGAIFGALDEVSLHRVLARRERGNLRVADRTDASRALTELLLGGLREKRAQP